MAPGKWNYFRVAVIRLRAAAALQDSHFDHRRLLADGKLSSALVPPSAKRRSPEILASY